MTGRVALAACALLLIAFGTLAMSAALRESATFDEPTQTVAGWIKLHKGDFRINIEDPPLWEEWAALPNGPDALRPDFNDPLWRELLDAPAKQWRFVTRNLWTTQGVDGAAFVNRSRAMMLLVGLALGAFIAFWAWKLAGPIAGVAALALYALDPNFLGHSALVKNDVPAAFAMLAASWLTWRLGQRLTLANMLALALVFGLALNMKFSCVLLAPMLGALLLVRALTPEPWAMDQRSLGSRAQRLGAAAVVLLMLGVVAFLSIWAAYRFRFSATPNPSEHISTAWVLGHLERAQTAASHGQPWAPDLVTRVFLWMLEHHVLPESWLNGFLFTYATAVLRRGFLLGHLSATGFWYYFPVAMLLKTPVATIVTAVLTGIVAFVAVGPRLRTFGTLWAAACLLIPPGIYLGSSMRTNMNIGIRHVFPLYVFGFVIMGVLTALAIDRWGRRASTAALVLAVVLAGETLWRAPHYIAFFNAVAGGPRAGLRLLGDSNLDWGQDLPLLARWQQEHPDSALYLSYFGMTDPAYYGIRYHPLAGNYVFGPPLETGPLPVHAVVAVSASHLQGISVGTKTEDRVAPLLAWTPREVLGGTIYLYDVPDEAAAVSLQRLTVP